MCIAIARFAIAALRALAVWSRQEQREEISNIKYKQNDNKPEMNLTTKIMKCSFVALAMIAMAACTYKEQAPEIETTADGTEVPAVIRYIDADSIMANYNLAKDIQEVRIKYSDELNKREQNFNNFQKEMQNKYQNNGYLSQESFDRDQRKLQNLQNEYQNYYNLAQDDMLQFTIQINDSLDNFLKDFAEAEGYDLILNKAAASYISPKYDVTAAVVAGLNSRYTKVEKK